TNFQKLCMDLLERSAEGGPSHSEKIDEIQRLFPKTRKWLDGWIMADVAATLFPSHQATLKDGENIESIPDPTNPRECMHRRYFMVSEGKKWLMDEGKKTYCRSDRLKSGRGRTQRTSLSYKHQKTSRGPLRWPGNCHLTRDEDEDACD
ncbi:hypothetical protein PTTG_12656, partial [Puccinia triticina 1-1 BBBD Race 1]